MRLTENCFFILTLNFYCFLKKRFYLNFIVIRLVHFTIFVPERMVSIKKRLPYDWNSNSTFYFRIYLMSSLFYDAAIVLLLVTDWLREKTC